MCSFGADGSPQHEAACRLVSKATVTHEAARGVRTEVAAAVDEATTQRPPAPPPHCDRESSRRCAVGSREKRIAGIDTWPVIRGEMVVGVVVGDNLSGPFKVTILLPSSLFKRYVGIAYATKFLFHGHFPAAAHAFSAAQHEGTFPQPASHTRMNEEGSCCLLRLFRRSMKTEKETQRQK